MENPEVDVYIYTQACDRDGMGDLCRVSNLFLK